MSDELPRNVDPLPAAIPREERERIVEQLSDCFAHDLLPVAEFEYRVAAAYRVPTRAELVRLIADLPTMGGVDSAVATMPRYVSVVLGNSEQAISGTVPPLLDIRVVMGNAELDLSQARFAAGVTEIRISAFMGNVEITLPPGVAVENQGSSFLGNFEYWGTPDRAVGSAGPGLIVRVTGRAALSSVEIGN